jgi:AbrB family looped-hinge helix DNA binding protein
MSRVTSKGQVTIPVKIREKLGIHPETNVVFEIDGNAVRIRKAASRSRGPSIVSRMRGRATTRLSTDQIMALTRG